jgi:hypothetical protein
LYGVIAGGKREFKDNGYSAELVGLALRYCYNISRL